MSRADWSGSSWVKDPQLSSPLSKVLLDESLVAVRETWNHLAQTDPLWAILYHPDKDQGRWDLNEFMATGRQQVTVLMDQVRKRAPLLSFGTALDFGCGIGRLSQALADYFGHVTGVDISREMVALARLHNQHGERCAYVLNEKADLQQFEDSTFDFVHSDITLQHIPPALTSGYLAEFVRIVRPAGLIVFQLPSHPPAIRRLRTMFRHKAPQVHRLYRSIRYWHRRPPEEAPYPMYCIAQERVRQIVHDAGGEIVAAVQDTAAGPGLVSIRYFGRKSAPAP